MRQFTGARPVGQAGPWLLLLLQAAQLANGNWRYTYSVAPGVVVYIVAAPGPDMLPAHDDIYARLAAQLARRVTSGP